MKHHAFAADLEPWPPYLWQPARPLMPPQPIPPASGPRSEGTAKIEVKKCGRGICANIVWLRIPNDCMGGLLRDTRNENPPCAAVRSSAFRSSSTWWRLQRLAGQQIYNPEDGNTYTDQADARFAPTRSCSRAARVGAVRREDLDSGPASARQVEARRTMRPIEVKPDAEPRPDEPAAARGSQGRSRPRRRPCRWRPRREGACRSPRRSSGFARPVVETRRQ